MLWSRGAEENARASLRQEIYRLLETLSSAGTEIMHVTRDHLALRPGMVWVDVEEVMRATPQQPQSLALLEGDLLEDLDGLDPVFDAWLTRERERLRDRARGIAEASLNMSSEPDSAIPAAQRLLQIDRSHEGAWRALMRAHSARGEHGIAFQAYDRCRAVLADMLDAAPSQETQRLLAEIGGPYGARIAAGPTQTRPPAKSPQANEQPHTEPVAVLEPRLRGGARVGVLPPQFPGATEEEAYLAPGLAEEITSALSRFRWMSIVASGSLARFAIEPGDEAAIRRMFGIDFLLDGTIQRLDTHLRITLRLLDLRAGNEVIWARRFDRENNDLLSLQDEVAAEVVAQINPEILLIEAQRSALRPPSDATAYDLMLRAIPQIGRLERTQFMQAGESLSRAIDLEPEYATAVAWYAYWNAFLVGQNWSDDPRAVMLRAGELAEKAILLDPFDAWAMTIAGHVRAYLHRRPREALVLHDRALSLNPNLAMAWALSACAYAYIGEPEEAERRNNRYKKLSPLDPQAFFYDTFYLYIHLLKGDFEAAVTVGRTVCEMSPSFSASHKLYLAALGHTGRKQEAEMVRRRLLALEPDFSVAKFLATTPLEREADRELLVEGLRLASRP